MTRRSRPAGDAKRVPAQRNPADESQPGSRGRRRGRGRGAGPGPGGGQGEGAASGAAPAPPGQGRARSASARATGRDPKLLGDQLDQFVTERGWVGDVAVGAVIGRWSQIVGPEIAQHCAPVDFVDGILTVRADSTAWATQLRLLSSSLLTRLAEDVGEGTVGELRVVGPGAPTWSRGPRRVQDGRGPRDTYG